MQRGDLVQRIEQLGYGMGDVDAFEAMRAREYPALRDQVYLDHAASPPAPLTPIQAFTASLSSTLLTNPHSRSTSSVETSLAIARIRQRVLSELYGVPTARLDEWDVVFTAGGATQGIKTVGEAWDWRRKEAMGGRPGFSYLVESHTSLVGLRGIALSRSSAVSSHPTPSSLLQSARASSASFTDHPTLYVYPAQCNATGARLGLRFCAQIKRADPMAAVLVDAAAYSATSVLDLGSMDEKDAPDFVVASAYKIFGWPTSLGFLVVKRSSAHLLSRPAYFGGGSISSLSLSSPYTHTSRSSPSSSSALFPPLSAPPPSTIHETLEVGTPPFLEIVVLGHALDWLQTVTHGQGLAAVSQHAASLSDLARSLLGDLEHAPLVLGGPGGKVFVEHQAFRGGADEAELPEPYRIVLEPPGPTIGFTLLSPPSASSPTLLSSSFALPASPPEGTDYRPSIVGHVHLARLAVVSGISLRSGGLCNTGVWARAFGMEDEELRELEARGRRCWDDEEFSPLPPHRPLGISRISFGLSSTVDDVLAFVDFVKRFFVRTEEVAALEAVSLRQNEQLAGEGKIRKARLTEVLLYPIKSCAAQSLPPSLAWPLTPTGLLYDRELMLVSSATGRALSQKRYPRMALIRPEIDLERGLVTLRAKGMEELVLPLELLRADELCRTPPRSDDGHSPSRSARADPADVTEAPKPTLLCGTSVASVRLSSLADDWFTRFLNPSPLSSFSDSTSPSSPGPGPVELRCLPSGAARHAHFDGAEPGPPLPLRLSNESPFLLVSGESVRAVNGWIAAGGIGGETAKAIKATAFRPNFVVEALATGGGGGEEKGLPPFWEDRVAALRIGEGVFAPLGRCRRCLMVAVDQETGLKTREPLASLSLHRKSATSGRVEFGMHLHLREELAGATEGGMAGKVRVGDEVVVSLEG
ncbi:hypothetical protein JCM10207_000546 [Rhodosporidiobolus poonsookiae]